MAKKLTPPLSLLLHDDADDTTKQYGEDGSDRRRGTRWTSIPSTVVGKVAFVVLVAWPYGGSAESNKGDTEEDEHEANNGRGEGSNEFVQVR